MKLIDRLRKQRETEELLNMGDYKTFVEECERLGISFW